ncbi:hypothetical protein Btru_019143 [Bulinus truncatus]|nr:hypothetical protein Btru_019143 [Bulinus truncatus]
MLLTSSVVILLCVVSATAGPFIVMTPGNCPDIPLKQNLDVNQYMGKWYTSESFPAPFQAGMSCITAEYSLNSNGTVRVKNTGVREVKFFGKTIFRSNSSIVGEAKIMNSSQPAGLHVQFPGQPDFDKNKPNYLVLDTDYTNYSLVYSCSKPISIFPKAEIAWILARTPGVKPLQTTQLKALLTSYGVDVKYFKRIDFSNCQSVLKL